MWKISYAIITEEKLTFLDTFRVLYGEDDNLFEILILQHDFLFEHTVRCFLFFADDATLGISADACLKCEFFRSLVAASFNFSFPDCGL